MLQHTTVRPRTNSSISSRDQTRGAASLMSPLSTAGRQNAAMPLRSRSNRPDGRGGLSPVGVTAHGRTPARPLALEHDHVGAFEDVGGGFVGPGAGGAHAGPGVP